MVIVGKGCGVIRELKSIICDIDKEVLWYVYKSGVLRVFVE